MKDEALNPGTRFKEDFERAKNLKQIYLNQNKLVELSNKRFPRTKLFFGQILSSQVFSRESAVSITESKFIKTLSPSSTKFIGYRVYIPELNGIYPSFKDSELRFYLDLTSGTEEFDGKKYDLATLLATKSKQEKETFFKVETRLSRYSIFFCPGGSQEPSSYPQYCEVEVIDPEKPLHYGTFKRVIGDALTKVDYEPEETDLNE